MNDANAQSSSTATLGVLSNPAWLANRLRGAGRAVKRVAILGLRRKVGGHDAFVRFACILEQGASEVLGYARVMDADRYSDVASKWKHPLPTLAGPGVVVVPELSTLLFLLPNDHRLRGAPSVLDRDRLKRLLSDLPEFRDGGWRLRGRKLAVDILRYKPEQRLILTATSEAVRDKGGEKRQDELFLRLFDDDRGLLLDQRARAVREAAGDIVPTPLGTALEGQLFVETRLRGEDLAANGLPTEAIAEELVALITRFQRSHVPQLQKASLGQRRIELKRSIGWLRELLRPADTLLGELASHLEGLDFPTARTVHGDFHLHQVLSTQDGLRIVDLERMHEGPGLSDLAGLLAQIEALAPDADDARHEALSEALRAHWFRTWPTDRESELRPLLAAALLEQALLPLRRGDADADERALNLLEKARTLVSPPNAFVTGPPAPVHTDPLERDVFPRTKAPWPARERRPGEAWSYGTVNPDGTNFEALEPEHDPSLPSLRRFVAQGRLVAWRPLNRAVVALPDGFAKVLRKGRAAAMARQARSLAIAAIGSNVRLPRVLTVRDDALILETVHGTPLTELAEISSTIALAVAAAALDFHRLARSVVIEERPARTLGTWCSLVAPGIDDERSRLAAELDDRPSAPATGLIHGDLHGGNVLLTSTGIAFIDTDDVRPGVLAEDLGNLAAHLILMAWIRERDGRALANEFLADAHCDQDPRELRLFVAKTLLRMSCVHRLRSLTAHFEQALVRESTWWWEHSL